MNLGAFSPRRGFGRCFGWDNGTKGVDTDRNRKVQGLSPEALPGAGLDVGAAKKMRRGGCWCQNLKAAPLFLESRVAERKA